MKLMRVNIKRINFIAENQSAEVSKSATSCRGAAKVDNQTASEIPSIGDCEHEPSLRESSNLR